MKYNEVSRRSRKIRCNSCGEVSLSTSYCTNCGNVFQIDANSSSETLSKEKFYISPEELEALFPEENITFTCKPEQKLLKAIMKQRIINTLLVLMSSFGFSIVQAGTLSNYTFYLIAATGGVITVVIFSIIYGLAAGKRLHSVYVITDKRAAVVNGGKIIKSWDISEMGHVGYRYIRIYKEESYSVFFWKKSVNIDEYINNRSQAGETEQSIESVPQVKVGKNNNHLSQEMKYRTVMRGKGKYGRNKYSKNIVNMFPYLSEENAKKITLNYLKDTNRKIKKSRSFDLQIT